MKLSFLPADVITSVQELPTVTRHRATLEACEELQTATALYRGLVSEGRIADGDIIPIASQPKYGNGSAEKNAPLMALVAKLNRHGKRPEFGFKFSLRTTVDDEGVPVKDNDGNESYTVYMLPITTGDDNDQ